MLRWIGAPVGTLATGEDTLKPRLILLADEQLTGPARDKVAARAERSSISRSRACSSRWSI